ncbi:MAG: hypothetical protein WKF92_10605 [Pyrinomonadaceae bacterium]
MMQSVTDELQTMYINFDQAERQWLNRFDDLISHVDKANSAFAKALPIGKAQTLKDDVEIMSNFTIAAMGLSAVPAAIAVPVVIGLKKLAEFVDAATAVIPPSPNLMAVKNNILEIRSAFKDTTEHIGGQIVQLLEKSKRSSGTGTVQEINSAVGKLLLSPIWYPPPVSATRNPGLPGVFEMRLWFRYFKQLSKMSPSEQMFGGIDYSPMFGRFKEIGFEPSGINIIKGYTPKGWGWTAEGQLHFAFKALNSYGEKHMKYSIPHKYPAEVQKYISLGSPMNFMGAGKHDTLPPSSLTWASVSL